MFSYPLRSLLMLYSALVLAGCATATAPPQSGFLVDYSDFTVDQNDDSLLWWERETFDWRQYNKIIVDPIAIYFHSDAEGNEIQADSLSNLISQCHQEIIAHLSDEFEVVETPGTGVLRVRSAVTNVIPANVGLNVMSTMVAFFPLDMGGASMEVEFIDTMSQVRQAAGMDTKLGIPTQVKSGFTSLGHARKACRDWSEELVVALKTNP